MADTPPGLRRVAHSLAHQAPLRFARRLLEVGAEVAGASVVDAWQARRPRPNPILRLEPGVDPRPAARSVALYAHFNAHGVISPMVLQQLDSYRDAGFAVVFVSMAPCLAEDAWQQVRDRCALVVLRRNGGLDFGAWKDVAPEARRRWPDAEEVLLVNDSVLGPLRSMAQIFAILRAAGDGIFGMTESVQGGHHLQSYFVLVRGRVALTALHEFLADLRPSVSKWLVVQRGEIGLTRHMQQRGLRVEALFSYARLVRTLIGDPEELAYLATVSPRLRPLLTLPAAELETLLLRWPLNPTHALWRCLVRRLGFPFIKSALLHHHPGPLPDVADWYALQTAQN